MSSVNNIPAATPGEAVQHFSAKFTFETDCWDVHQAMIQGADDFVLLDVRSPEDYRAGHLPGAINLPHGKIIGSKMTQWPMNALFVVYCAGPHCNGADRAALRLAKLDRPTKIMIGGIWGWVDEGFKLARGENPASIREVETA